MSLKIHVGEIFLKRLSSLNDGCGKESTHDIKNNKYINLNFLNGHIFWTMQNVSDYESDDSESIELEDSLSDSDSL